MEKRAWKSFHSLPEYVMLKLDAIKSFAVVATRIELTIEDRSKRQVIFKANNKYEPSVRCVYKAL